MNSEKSLESSLQVDEDLQLLPDQRLGVADVWFDVMLSLAAGDASGIGVSETLLEALAPARRNRVRSGKAARFYGLRRPADAAAPAA
jgi:hypothetical protein